VKSEKQNKENRHRPPSSASAFSRHRASFSPKAKPEAIQNVLAGALQSYALKRKVEEYAAFPYWQDIVGPEIAEIAIPEKISRGRILNVRVIDAVWAQELSLMKQRIIDGMHRFGRGAVVEDVKFVIGNPLNFKKSKV
jgi:hypothetical protein